MAVWPAALPQKFLIGTSDARLPAVVRFTVDAGPAKTRKLFNNPTRQVRWRLQPLSQTQREALDAFFITTLSEGALPFDYADPSTGQTRQYRFLSPPQYGAAANALGRLWDIAPLELELLP